MVGILPVTGFWVLVAMGAAAASRVAGTLFGFDGAVGFLGLSRDGRVLCEIVSGFKSPNDPTVADAGSFGGGISLYLAGPSCEDGVLVVLIEPFRQPRLSFLRNELTEGGSS